MNFKQIISAIIIAFVLQGFTTHNENEDWGRTGHRVIGEIAYKYLDGSTKRKIRKLLKGQSLAKISTFADDIKSDKRYNKFYSWHYVNLNDDDTYESSSKNSKGDLVTGIATCKKIIKDKKSSKEDKIFYLKMLVHLIGDLHQPLHVGRKTDKGGNDFQVQWFNKGTNLHRVWDTQMITDYGMTYTELANNADKLTKKQVKAIKKGSIVNWVNETKVLAQKTYKSAKKGENLRYRYMYDNFETVRSQLQKGGIRLAKVLNELF